MFDLITKVKWQPAIGEFGIWPLVTATLTTSLIAMLIALAAGVDDCHLFQRVCL